MPIDPQRSANRREFFRDSLRHLLQPLADYLDAPRGDDAVSPRWLRPPGALPEGAFLEVCTRCHHCAEACPADAIVPLVSNSEALRDTPVIYPGQSPCVVCDELSCMDACPSGALVPVASRFEIRMGLAVVSESRCVRSRGEDCRLCLDSCPLGPAAIQLDRHGRVEVLDPGCVGCGVCEYHCPTEPKAIVIGPPAERSSRS